MHCIRQPPSMCPEKLAEVMNSMSWRSRAAVKPGACLILGVLILLSGCSPHAGPPAAATDPANSVPPTVQRLLRLMRDRLVLMHDVARTKWNTKRPVGDPNREQAVLQEMEKRSEEYGLAPEFTRAFFAAQIAAARLVQEADHARWRAEERGAFADAPDLTVLRMRIDEINRHLLDALTEARPLLGDASTCEPLRRWSGEILIGEGIAEDVRAAAIAPLVAQ